MKRAVLAKPANGERAGQFGAEEFELERTWLHNGRVILKFCGIDSITAANELRGFDVMVPYEDRVKLPAGTYYVSELEGCRVVSLESGSPSEVGRVTAVEPTGGVPLLRLSAGAGQPPDLLIPLAAEICREINPEEKVIVIQPPPGLLELNARSSASTHAQRR